MLVDLADCDDPEEYLSQIAVLPCLETLVVGGLTFTDEDLDRLKNIDTLLRLVLDSTSVTDDGIGSLKKALPALAIHKSQRRSILAVREYGGEFSVRTITTVSGASEATDVYLAATQFDDVGMMNFIVLTEVERLDLTGTHITDAGLAHLKSLAKLRLLYLNGTQVTDDGLSHLMGPTNLRWLFLPGAGQVTDARVKELQKALPNCEIIH